MHTPTSKRHISLLLAAATALAVFLIWGRPTDAVMPEPTTQTDTLPMAYAENITMIRHQHYCQVDIKNPWKKGHLLHRYILVSREDSALLGTYPEGTVVYTPVSRSVVFTSAHCQLLCWLGAEDAVSGVCDKQFINIPAIRQHAEDCGDGMMPMVEKIADLHPQALLISPFENSGGYGRLEQIGIPIIETADYMETSALGRAEWMRFYGMLYGKARQADSLFHVVDSCYQALRILAHRQPEGRSFLTERLTGSTWYVPGGRSTIGTMLADANARYLWAADTHSGSLPLSFEAVIDKAADSDVWLIKSHGTAPTRNTLLSEHHGYDMFAAVRNQQVYYCNTLERPYFEEVSFRPDYLLRELILLAHPGILPADTLRYYCRMTR
jgi:iron complex transport system substrate-binding protein